MWIWIVAFILPIAIVASIAYYRLSMWCAYSRGEFWGDLFDLRLLPKTLRDQQTYLARAMEFSQKYSSTSEGRLLSNFNVLLDRLSSNADDMSIWRMLYMERRRVLSHQCRDR